MMHTIKILGTGCANCVRTTKIVKRVVEENAFEAAIEKVEDLPGIMSYGVMSTPGVVIDEKVVHSGSVPTEKQILEWLAKYK